jgi:hypothetical protein
MFTTMASFAFDFDLSDFITAFDPAVRVSLWKLVRTYLFSAAPAAVPLVWVAEPIGGDPERMPDDVAELIESWFVLIEADDALTFLASVAAALPPALARDFVGDCRSVLATSSSERRVA